MIAFLTSRIGKLVSALVVAATLLLGVFQFGRKAQRNDDRVDGLEQYIETKKEIDDVEVSTNPDAAHKRLRRNGWVR